MRRAVTAIVATGALLLSSLLPAVGHNWGAGSWHGPAYACLDNNPQGECTADNNFHLFAIDSTVGPGWTDAFEESVQEDYNFSDFETQIWAGSSIYDTDAYVKTADVRAAGYWIYETCGGSSVHGGGTGYYEYCDPHKILYDPTRDNECDPACKAYLACHELGHTTGLAHPGTYPNSSADRVTCMDYDGHTILGDHDREHLQDCYPRPSPPPYNLTTACDDHQ